MRLAFAIAVLSQSSRLLTALEPSSSVRRQLRQRRPGLSVQGNSTENDVLGKHHTRHHKFGNLLRSRPDQFKSKGTLKNSAGLSTGDFKECHPGAEADIGILGCGPNEHCVESGDSGMGGFCVSDSKASRSLQQYLVRFCDPNCIYGGTCDCSQFDSTTNVGSFTCEPYDYYCIYDNLCGSIHLGLTSSEGGGYYTEICYDIVVPYELPVCYQYESTPTCSITIGDTECQSCEVVDVADADGTASGCFEFDCTNTIAKIAGNDCRNEFVLEALSARFNTGTDSPAVAPSVTAPPTPSPTNPPVTPPPTPTPTGAPVSPRPTLSPTNAPVAPPPTPSPTAAPVTRRPTPSPTGPPTTPVPTPSPTDAPVTPSPTPSPTDSPVTPMPTLHPSTSPMDAPVTPEPTPAPTTPAPATPAPTAAPVTDAPAISVPMAPEDKTDAPVASPTTDTPTPLPTSTPEPSVTAPPTPTPASSSTPQGQEEFPLVDSGASTSRYQSLYFSLVPVVLVVHYFLG